MISFDFEYYKPETLAEAYECFVSLDAAGKSPLYYAGGTEIISMARAESIHFGAVIDLKGIPECSRMNIESGRLIIGSCVTLTQIAEANLFPLLSETVSRIADHTIQDKITLGGNLAGTIIYREAALPLLITNSTAKVLTAGGLIEYPFLSIFDGRLKLKKGDILIHIAIDEENLHLPYAHVKKTRNEKIDYPLITLCGLKNKEVISAALSGLANAPVILPSDILSNRNRSVDERIQALIETIRNAVLTDILASKEYREFVLGNILKQMYRNFSEA